MPATSDPGVTDVTPFSLSAVVAGLVPLPFLLAAYQVTDIIQAVESEGNADTWSLKLVTIVSLVAAAWCARIALARPSPVAQRRVERENDELRRENRQLGRELRDALIECAQLRGMIGPGGGWVQGRPPLSPGAQGWGGYGTSQRPVGPSAHPDESVGFPPVPESGPRFEDQRYADEPGLGEPGGFSEGDFQGEPPFPFDR